MRVFALWFRVHWTEVCCFSNGEETVLAMARSLFGFNDKAKFFAHFLPLYFAEAANAGRR